MSSPKLKGLRVSLMCKLNISLPRVHLCVHVSVCLYLQKNSRFLGQRNGPFITQRKRQQPEQYLTSLPHIPVFTGWYNEGQMPPVCAPVGGEALWNYEIQLLSGLLVTPRNGSKSSGKVGKQSLGLSPWRVSKCLWGEEGRALSLPPEMSLGK